MKSPIIYSKKPQKSIQLLVNVGSAFLYCLIRQISM